VHFYNANVTKSWFRGKLKVAMSLQKSLRLKAELFVHQHYEFVDPDRIESAKGAPLTLKYWLHIELWCPLSLIRPILVGMGASHCVACLGMSIQLYFCTLFIAALWECGDT
jgi:hypothetical protein